MNPENPTQNQNPQEIHNPLAVMQVGEQVVCEIKRHPVGLIGIYGTVIFLLIVLTVIIFGVVPAVFTTVDHTKIYSAGAIILLIAGVLGAGFAFMNHVIYWGNRWVVTTDSLTQVQQTSLFNKQSSQLSLENIEDVTAEQNGILADMFHFGTLRVETAGERSKFLFTFCPDPNGCAQKILNARERFMQDIRSKESARLTDPVQNVPDQPNINTAQE